MLGGPDNGFDADIKIIGFRADWEAVSAHFRTLF